MNNQVLIPVKPLDVAKSRLAKTLSLPEREKLIISMLAHVLKVVTTTSLFNAICVASADETILAFAKKQGATPLFVPLQNHNSDLQTAALKAPINNADRLLTLSADLPLLTINDINKLYELMQTNDIVLAPSKEKTGTNAIFSKPQLVPYLFGPGSFANYQHAAEKINLQTAVYTSPTIAFDVDTPKDLTELLRRDEKYAAILEVMKL